MRRRDGRRPNADARRLRRWTNGEPALLLYHGAILRQRMREQRLAEEEILAAVRSQAIAGIEEVDAVVLETDGTFGVVRRTRASYDSLSDVPDDPPGREERGSAVESGGSDGGKPAG